MVLVADEGVDRQIIDRLASRHNVHAIADHNRGASDEVVLQIARERDAVLVTGDKDVGERVFRRRLIHSGVILLRLSGMDPDEKASVVANATAAHESEMPGGFPVIGPTSLRIRSGPSRTRMNRVRTSRSWMRKRFPSPSRSQDATIQTAGQLGTSSSRVIGA